MRGPGGRKQLHSVNICGLGIYMTLSLINISPPFRMELRVNETCVYAVDGVRTIDKFHQVHIKLITNESPFDSWQFAYHKCQITQEVAPQWKRATAGPVVSL